jgi:folate-dependent phosphoribosylglycinamide formyltransferase PurN
VRKEIDLILLAGYMRIIGPDLLSAYEQTNHQYPSVAAAGVSWAARDS